MGPLRLKPWFGPRHSGVRMPQGLVRRNRAGCGWRDRKQPKRAVGWSIKLVAFVAVGSRWLTLGAKNCHALQSVGAMNWSFPLGWRASGARWSSAHFDPNWIGWSGYECFANIAARRKLSAALRARFNGGGGRFGKSTHRFCSASDATSKCFALASSALSTLATAREWITGVACTRTASTRSCCAGSGPASFWIEAGRRPPWRRRD